jgi:ABC-2 type transport system ATP-binding protein
MAGDKTVLLSTHILPEVESTCGRVVIIHRGRLVGEGAPGTLRLAGQGENVLSLESSAPRSELEPLVRSAQGVLDVLDAVALSEGITRLRLRTDGPGAAESVFRAVAAAGLSLRELHSEQTSLEDVFASLTTRDRAQEAADEAAAEDAAPAEEASP